MCKSNFSSCKFILRERQRISDLYEGRSENFKNRGVKLRPIIFEIFGYNYVLLDIAHLRYKSSEITFSQIGMI